MLRKGSVPQTPARTGVSEMMGRISLAFVRGLGWSVRRFGDDIEFLVGGI